MKTKKFLIAEENSTLLVWGCPEWKKSQIIKKYLGDAEQIGFIEDSNGISSLKMMGGELCINATIALASQLGADGKLKTSGLNQEIEFKNKNKFTYLKFSLPFTREGNIVLFPGIGFICSSRLIYGAKKELSSLAKKYSLPAFGVVSYQDNKITPYVYVRNTNSLVEETACGSGSIAYSIVTGYSKVIHPTGQSILVRQRGDLFIVGAKVVKIEENYD